LARTRYLSLKTVWSVAMNRFRDLLRCTAGATSIEYAAIASLISIVAITAMSAIGISVGGLLGMVPAF
jgi:Flp pilus assembly pilin Flp